MRFPHWFIRSVSPINRETSLTGKLNLGLSVEQAVRLGQRLIDEKFIHHVTDDHPFINDFFFYRFYWDEINN